LQARLKDTVNGNEQQGIFRRKWALKITVQYYLSYS